MKFLVLYLFVTIASISIQLTHTNANIDPYKVLGLRKGVDERDIKNAYRKLAKHWLVVRGIKF